MPKKFKKRKNSKAKKSRSQNSRNSGGQKIGTSQISKDSEKVVEKEAGTQETSSQKISKKVKKAKKVREKKRGLLWKFGYYIGRAGRLFYEEFSRPKYLKLNTYLCFLGLLLLSPSSYVVETIGFGSSILFFIIYLSFFTPSLLLSLFMGLFLSYVSYYTPLISLKATLYFVLGIFLIEVVYYLRDNLTHQGSRQTLLYSKAKGTLAKDLSGDLPSSLEGVGEGSCPKVIKFVDGAWMSSLILLGSSLLFLGGFFLYKDSFNVNLSLIPLSLFTGYYATAAFFISLLPYMPNMERSFAFKNKKGKQITRPRLVSVYMALLLLLLPAGICYQAVSGSIPIYFMLCGIVIWHSNKAVEAFSESSKSDKEILSQVNTLLFWASVTVLICFY